MIFPGPSGPRRAQRVAYPPDGLPLGYYPVNDEVQTLQQRAASTNSRGGATAKQSATSSRIMEVTDVAAVEAIRSADRDATSCDLV